MLEFAYDICLFDLTLIQQLEAETNITTLWRIKLFKN